MAELSAKSQDATGSVIDPMGSSEEIELHLVFDGANARRVPWISGPDWADQDSAYLLISGFYDTLSGAALCAASWSPATAMSFKPDTESAVEAIHVELGGNIIEGGAVVFPVPDDMTEGTLTIEPEASVIDTCSVTEPMSSIEIPIDMVSGD